MDRLLSRWAVLGLLGFGLVAGPVAFFAARAEAMPMPEAQALVQAVTPASQFSLELLLNGDCSGTGSLNITSTGTSATIATLADGAVYSLSCDAAVHQRQGTSVTTSFTATPTTFGEKVAASPDRYRFVQHGVNFAVISVSGTANCVLARCH